MRMAAIRFERRLVHVRKVAVELRESWETSERDGRP
jgi:hypothetical protein